MNAMNVEYNVSGSGGAQTVILGSSLGTDGFMWSEQVRLLPSHWNVVTFDLRGHGASPLSLDPPSIDDFADDVIAIADDLSVERFAFCGLSIGGAIGQSLAARHPGRISSLVLASTGLTILSPQALQERSERVLAEGTAWIAEVSASRWFTERFLKDRPETVEAHMRHLRQMVPRAYSDACLALAGFDGRRVADSIAAPTLVLAGEDDVATPPAGGRELASAIRNAELRLIPESGHLCSVEQPEMFTDALRGHIEAYG